MIELKKKFVRKGSEYNQLYKDDCLVIYSVSRKKADDDTFCSWYEVFRRIVREKDSFHDDEYERLPFDEAFGVWAWSCSNLKVVEKVLKKHFEDCVDNDKILKLLSCMKN